MIYYFVITLRIQLLVDPWLLFHWAGRGGRRGWAGATFESGANNFNKRHEIRIRSDETNPRIRKKREKERQRN